MIAVLVALGCKNTFAAIVPAQVALRMWPTALTSREAWRKHGFRALALASVLALPVGALHLLQVELAPRPVPVRRVRRSRSSARVLSALKGGMGLDFLGAGVALATVVAAARVRCVRECRAAVVCGVLLAGCGAVAYLPMDDMSGRYTMPAVWGLDILFALLLAALVKAPAGRARALALLALCAGLVALLTASVLRQEKVAARARMLWQVVHHLEATAPPGAGVDVGERRFDPRRTERRGRDSRRVAPRERGRADIRIALFDANEQPLQRVELTSPTGGLLLRVSGSRTSPPNWKPDRSASEVYQLGRKRYDCHVSRRSAPTLSP